MATFYNKEIKLSDINGGVRYENGDIVDAEAINAPIEASAYAQQKAKEAYQLASEASGQVNVSLQGKTFPNPNILDNWYFINPINQRGVTAFNGGYGIDRWVGSSGVSVTDSGLYFNSGNIMVAQRLEESTKVALNGRTITASCMTTKGVYSASAVYHYPTSQYTFLYSDEFHVAITKEGAVMFWSVAPCTLIAVKLEVGNMQTLAYQDGDGNWKLQDPPPNPATELAKCQRYQVVYNGYSFLGYGTALSTTSTTESEVRFSLTLPTTMRLSTAVVQMLSGSPKFYSVGATYEGHSLQSSASLNVSTAYCKMNIAKVGTNFDGNAWLNYGDSLILDANL